MNRKGPEIDPSVPARAQARWHLRTSAEWLNCQGNGPPGSLPPRPLRISEPVFFQVDAKRCLPSNTQKSIPRSQSRAETSGASFLSHAMHNVCLRAFWVFPATGARPQAPAVVETPSAYLASVCLVATWGKVPTGCLAGMNPGTLEKFTRNDSFV